MEFFCGPVAIRTLGKMAKGDRTDVHKHHFDHAMQCLEGSALVVRGNGETFVLDSRAPLEERSLNIPADETHGVIAREDGTLVQCVFPRQPGSDLMSDPAYGERNGRN